MMTSITTTDPQKRKGAPDADSASDPPSKKLLTFHFTECPIALDLLQDLKLPRTFFQRSTARAWSLPPTDPTFHLINSYVERSRKEIGQAQILAIFEIITNFGNSPTDHKKDPNILRKMLWHGTRPRNIPNILKKGLKMPKRKSDPYFGAGIYFSDNFSYSLGYSTYKDKVKDKDGRLVSYVFLSDVLLGDIYKTNHLMPKAPILKTKVPGRKLWDVKILESVLGHGKINTDPEGDQLVNGCVWPVGEKRVNPLTQVGRLVPANEYVVYEECRVIPKYLIKVEYPENLVGLS